jgi:hypothetical protein
MWRQDIDVWEQCTHVTRIPRDDAWDVVNDRSLADQGVV